MLQPLYRVTKHHLRFVFKIWSYFSFTDASTRQSLLDQCVLNRRAGLSEKLRWFRCNRLQNKWSFKNSGKIVFVFFYWELFPRNDHGLRYAAVLANSELLRWFGKRRNSFISRYISVKRKHLNWWHLIKI